MRRRSDSPKGLLLCEVILPRDLVSTYWAARRSVTPPPRTRERLDTCPRCLTAHARLVGYSPNKGAWTCFSLHLCYASVSKPKAPDKTRRQRTPTPAASSKPRPLWGPRRRDRPRPRGPRSAKSVALIRERRSERTYGCRLGTRRPDASGRAPQQRAGALDGSRIDPGRRRTRAAGAADA